jgi:hypothetical protein
LQQSLLLLKKLATKGGFDILLLPELLQHLHLLRLQAALQRPH